MKTQIKKLALVTVALSLFGATAASAQSIERTPDGKPDFSGIWQANTSAHYNVEPHAASEGAHPRQMGAWSASPGG